MENHTRVTEGTLVYEDAEDLGRLVKANKEENIMESLSFVGRNLKKENGICLTDRDNQIKIIYGKSRPDFNRILRSEEHTSESYP